MEPVARLTCDRCCCEIEPGWDYVTFNGNTYCGEDCALDDIREFLEYHTTPKNGEAAEAKGD